MTRILQAPVKSFWMACCLSVPVLLLLPCLPSSESDSFAQADKDIALILKTVGTVQLSRSAAVNSSRNARWIRARKGYRLNSGNVVQTGRNSLASIVFTDDKSLLKVRSRSRATIKGKRDQQVKKTRKTITMRLGELWAKVTKGSFFRVETPSGVAAVKGTEFYAVSDENGMIIFCLKGIMNMFNDFGRVDVLAGERGQITPNGPPSKRPIRADEMPNWADDGNLRELEIEFENEAGQKKKLKIKIK